MKSTWMISFLLHFRKRSKDPNQKNQNQKKARRKSFYNIPSSSSEEQQNYEIQYQQMIKQLQNKVREQEKEQE